MVSVFNAQKIQAWARGLGQSVFTGSSGRVFPKSMKASPLLRAWFLRLDELGVERKTRWRFLGWKEGQLYFDTPDGKKSEPSDVVVFAMGGASWARLGSDGFWAQSLTDMGVGVAPFRGVNVGLHVNWTTHMERHFGHAIKGVAWSIKGKTTRGEAVISRRGIEGGGVYSFSKEIDNAEKLTIDLTPDLTLDEVINRLSKPRGKTSLSNHLRKALRLSPVKIALLREWVQPLPNDLKLLAAKIKSLDVNYDGLRPMDEAISTSGGVKWGALDSGLMLRNMPGVFCAGEMLDWSAPTGGYLLTGCLATGRWAGISASRYLGLGGTD